MGVQGEDLHLKVTVLVVVEGIDSVFAENDKVALEQAVAFAIEQLGKVPIEKIMTWWTKAPTCDSNDNIKSNPNPHAAFPHVFHFLVTLQHPTPTLTNPFPLNPFATTANISNAGNPSQPSVFANPQTFQTKLMSFPHLTPIFFRCRGGSDSNRTNRVDTESLIKFDMGRQQEYTCTTVFVVECFAIVSVSDTTTTSSEPDSSATEASNSGSVEEENMPPTNANEQPATPVPAPSNSNEGECSSTKLATPHELGTGGHEVLNTMLNNRFSTDSYESADNNPDNSQAFHATQMISQFQRTATTTTTVTSSTAANQQSDVNLQVPIKPSIHPTAHHLRSTALFDPDVSSESGSDNESRAKKRRASTGTGAARASGGKRKSSGCGSVSRSSGIAAAGSSARNSKSNMRSSNSKGTLPRNNSTASKGTLPRNNSISSNHDGSAQKPCARPTTGMSLRLRAWRHALCFCNRKSRQCQTEQGVRFTGVQSHSWPWKRAFLLRRKTAKARQIQQAWFGTHWSRNDSIIVECSSQPQPPPSPLPPEHPQSPHHTEASQGQRAGSCAVRFPRWVHCTTEKLRVRIALQAVKVFYQLCQVPQRSALQQSNNKHQQGWNDARRHSSPSTLFSGFSAMGGVSNGFGARTITATALSAHLGIPEGIAKMFVQGCRQMLSGENPNISVEMEAADSIKSPHYTDRLTLSDFLRVALLATSPDNLISTIVSPALSALYLNNFAKSDLAGTGQVPTSHLISFLNRHTPNSINDLFLSPPFHYAEITPPRAHSGGLDASPHSSAISFSQFVCLVHLKETNALAHILYGTLLPTSIPQQPQQQHTPTPTPTPTPPNLPPSWARKLGRLIFVSLALRHDSVFSTPAEQRRFLRHRNRPPKKLSPRRTSVRPANVPPLRLASNQDTQPASSNFAYARAVTQPTIAFPSFNVSPQSSPTNLPPLHHHATFQQTGGAPQHPPSPWQHHAPLPRQKQSFGNNGYHAQSFHQTSLQHQQSRLRQQRTASPSNSVTRHYTSSNSNRFQYSATNSGTKFPGATPLPGTLLMRSSGSASSLGSNSPFPRVAGPSQRPHAPAQAPAPAPGQHGSMRLGWSLSNAMEDHSDNTSNPTTPFGPVGGHGSTAHHAHPQQPRSFRSNSFAAGLTATRNPTLESSSDATNRMRGVRRASTGDTKTTLTNAGPVPSLQCDYAVNSVSQRNLNITIRNAPEQFPYILSVSDEQGTRIQSSGNFPNKPGPSDTPTKSISSFTFPVDISSLNDGTLSLCVSLPNPQKDNTKSPSAQERVLKLRGIVYKRTAPPCVESVICVPNVVNAHTQNAVTLAVTMNGDEQIIHGTYRYRIQDANGQSLFGIFDVPNDATIPAPLSTKTSQNSNNNNNTLSLGPLRLSSLCDGALTVSISILDTFGNSGPWCYTQALKDTHVPCHYTVVPHVSSITVGEDASRLATGLDLCVVATARGCVCVGDSVAFEVRDSWGPCVRGNAVVPEGFNGTFTIHDVDISSLSPSLLDISIQVTSVHGNIGPTVWCVVERVICEVPRLPRPHHEIEMQSSTSTK